MKSATSGNARVRFGLLAATPKQTLALDANVSVNLDQPFWSGRKMANEPVLFLKAQNAGTAAGNLFFSPSQNIAILSRNPDHLS